MKSGKTTIFRQLIFNIVIPTLLALLVFAVINFQHTSALINKNNEEKNRLLADEVTKVLKFQDIAINLIDSEFNVRLQDLSSILVNKYFVNSTKLEDLDLRAIANEIGMDPLNEDIYIISSDGVVINTTFREDLGFNLFTLGDVFKQYLLDILEGSCNIISVKF